MRAPGDIAGLEDWLKAEIGERMLTVAVSRADVEGADLYVSIDGLPGDSFGGPEPRASSSGVSAAVFSQSRRCMRLPCREGLGTLEFEIMAQAWRLGSSNIERIYSSGGYSEPGAGHMNSYGVAPYEISVGGARLQSHVGDHSIAEAGRAARAGDWFWRFAVSPRFRREGYPSFDPGGKWFRIAKEFDRAWGQMEGLQVLYHFDPRRGKGPRVEVYSLTLMQPTPWDGARPDWPRIPVAAGDRGPAFPDQRMPGAGLTSDQSPNQENHR